MFELSIRNKYCKDKESSIWQSVSKERGMKKKMCAIRRESTVLESKNRFWILQEGICPEAPNNISEELTSKVGDTFLDKLCSISTFCIWL